MISPIFPLVPTQFPGTPQFYSPRVRLFLLEVLLTILCPFRKATVKDAKPVNTKLIMIGLFHLFIKYLLAEIKIGS